MIIAIEERIAHMEGRMAEHTRTVDDVRSTLSDLRRTVHDFDERMSRYFLWLVGIQITALVAQLAATFRR